VNRIKDKLGTKIFLGIGLSLLISCILIFGMLRIVMPLTYEYHLSAQLMSNSNELILALEQTPQDQWEHLLTSFSIENGASINIGNGIGSIAVVNPTNYFVSYSFSSSFGVGIFHDIDVQENNLTDIMDISSLSIVQDFWSGGTAYTITVFGDMVTRSVMQVTDIFTEVFPYVLALILFISFVTAFVYSRILAKPIVKISNVSKRMANLELTKRCDTSRSDEIGILANNLNEMAEKLSASMDELKNANEKLQADIKKEREHERRRRDFFTAISHELKTPVTILKGELDGMILNIGKFKNRDKYLQEAYKTSESIEKLVREIMTLAKLDTICLQLDVIQLSEITDKVIDVYETIIQNKQIKVSYKYDKNAIVKADKIQMKTVISNIIGNAVKHSPKQCLVDISIIKNDDKVLLSVQNSDIKISSEELPLLWEPFYRTDKSRSRDTGGSGLGLYIVKTILDIHGFSYQFESTETGMMFTIEFPD